MACSGPRPRVTPNDTTAIEMNVSDRSSSSRPAKLPPERTPMRFHSVSPTPIVTGSLPTSAASAITRIASPRMRLS